MKLIKKLILRILKCPHIARLIIPIALKLHNLSYQLTGMLSPCLELDGLHPKHRLMKYHDWFTARLKTNWNVLDIGCGNGALAYDLKTSCATVFAIDINPANIELAKTRFARKGISYICGDATTYNFKNKFDAIVLSNVLEHIAYRIEFLQRIYANQNPDNPPPTLFLRVPMITRDWITLYKKEMGVEWRLDFTHFTEYTLEQLKKELNQANLLIENFDIQFGEFYGIVKHK